MLDRLFIRVFNHLLASSCWASERLLPFAGKSARLDIPPFVLIFSVTVDGYAAPCPESSHGIPADVIIRLPAQTPLLLLSGLDRLMSEATVSGNADFATELSFVLRNLRWDAEEDLSKLIGDIPAHRLISAGQGFLSSQSDLPTKAAQNIANFLTVETHAFVARKDLRLFSDNINRLTADLNRLETRVALHQSKPLAVTPTPTFP
jgi:ubiquinone biosynthesis protein UbiJ